MAAGALAGALAGAYVRMYTSYTATITITIYVTYYYYDHSTMPCIRLSVKLWRCLARLEYTIVSSTSSSNKT